MTVFRIHLRRPTGTEPDEFGMDFRDLHHAYLETCKAIPDMARDELIAGRDPMACAFLICNKAGSRLMEVPFADILSPSEWRIPRARRRPYGGERSDRVRDELALRSFRRMFDELQFGYLLMTPELIVAEINDYGARHTAVDRDAVHGCPVLDIFPAMEGADKTEFERFMLLARAGATSQIVDLPYLVQDEVGRNVPGFWKARCLPIFDDDDRLLGLVNWAEAAVAPSAGGRTIVRVAHGAAH